ncbi:MAG: hypothetical protein AB1750_08025 [Chloroflexota bacterium]
MNEEETEMKFHNEGIVSRLTTWGNIVSFVILAIAVIDLMWNGYVWYNQVLMSPYGTPGMAILVGSGASIVLMPFLAGVFYFLALRGLVQALNLGLDLYYRGAEEEEEEGIVA